MVAVAVVLLLGANRLPKIARSMGEARRELERVRAENDDTPDAPPEAESPPPSAVATPVVPATPVAPAIVVPVVEAAPLPPPLPPPAP